MADKIEGELKTREKYKRKKKKHRWNENGYNKSMEGKAKGGQGDEKCEGGLGKRPEKKRRGREREEGSTGEESRTMQGKEEWKGGKKEWKGRGCGRV
ncbi:hypothetical protein Pmani_008686 [Petrolisthes manimaculis]|uniref:Uncharacterized protein n=1 Tax=Petrolisthes manimaculis TaxID=1843537 RepID=A0AAE1Q550_9EUCA|nr:hypothetical protein Pmani_008686 [Petrolisthes manimaculis]